MSTHTPGFKYHSAVNLANVGRITGELVGSDMLEATIIATLSSSTATPEMKLIAGSGLALISEQQARRTSAQEQYAAMQIAQSTFAAFLSGDRVLALLACTMGDFTKAGIHFEDALAFWRKADYLVDMAKVEALDTMGEKEKAVELLERHV